MSKKSGSRADRKKGAGRASADPSGRAQPPPTPHRPVISLALVIFVPSLWMVLHGDLSVQTALIRFIGALLVSWVAAGIVFATLNSYAESARIGRRAAEASGPPDATGSGSPPAVGTGSPGSARPAGSLGPAGPTKPSA
jgi:hypothetical protein